MTRMYGAWIPYTHEDSVPDLSTVLQHIALSSPPEALFCSMDKVELAITVCPPKMFSDDDMLAQQGFVAWRIKYNIDGGEDGKEPVEGGTQRGDTP